MPPPTLTSGGQVVDLNTLGIDGASPGWRNRTVEHTYTDDTYETRYLGRSPATRTLTGVFAPKAPSYFSGSWEPETEWKKLLDPELDGEPWIYSGDGVAYLIIDLQRDEREWVNGQPLEVVWRIELKRQRFQR